MALDLSIIKTRPRLSGALVGLAITVLSIIYFFAIDRDKKLELMTFDYRIENFNRFAPTPPIVHVDIDDNSLDRVGRWPWDRHEQAELLLELHELGAAYVMIDLLLSEKQHTVIDDPAQKDGDILPVQTIGELSDANRRYSDLELAEAFRHAGHVILAAELESRAPHELPPLHERIRAWWLAYHSGGKSGPVPAPTSTGSDLAASTPSIASPATASPDRIIRDLGLDDSPDTRARVEREILRLRMREPLLADLEISDARLAASLNCSLSEIAANIAGVKTDVANERVGLMFAADPPPSAEQVLDALLKNWRSRDDFERAVVHNAYRLHRGLAALRHSLHPIAPAIAARLSRASHAVPPQFTLAEAAAELCAVNFRADADSIVRRVPIVIAYEGRALLHMGLAAACRILNLDADHMSLSPDSVLTIPRKNADAPLELPLDEDGSLIIHWTRTAPDWRLNQDFPHISAAKIYAAASAKKAIRDNLTTLEYLHADLVAATGNVQIADSADPNGATDASLAADNPHRQRMNDELALRRQAEIARLDRALPESEIRALLAQADALREQISQERRQAAQFVRLNCRELDKTTPDELAADPELAAMSKRFGAARKILDHDIPELEAANRDQQASIDRLRAELAPHIHGKFVFVGFAATAEGDIVATPIDPRTNGVMCHAHVLSSILQRSFIRPPARSTGILLCFLFGGLVSLITAVAGPRTALLAALGLMAGYLVLNCYVLFERYLLWVYLVAPLITTFLAWAFVTLFRQLTAERERRLFARELGQYTSPAIAAKIAEDPEAVHAFKKVQTRDVTCFFGDLAGFTTLSELEDAEVVQYVLNTYLERMSRVIWSTHGLINKFMGDGIMAFFNASVDPLDDHAHIACETTLQSLEALDRLIQEQSGGKAGPIFSKLHMRVGLASGLVKNGDMGSELKADYTVIGDVVNLAARLEPANKVFGTRIMTSAPTRDRVRDHYEFRYLAELRVKGKKKTVPVYELVCRKGDLTDDQRAYIERFESGVELYKARKWDECIVHFTRLLARRPDDLGASRYVDACQELKTFPPDEDWAGALELKEK